MEEAAYSRLHQEVLTGLLGLKLEDSAQALRLLLRIRLEKGKWDWGVFQDLHNLWVLELKEKDEATYASLVKVKEILDRTFEQKRKKGKLLNIHEVKWTRAHSRHLEHSLKIIVENVNERVRSPERNPAVTLLLIGMAFISLFENKGRFIEDRINRWLMPTEPTPSARYGVTEDFLTINEKGHDGKSDSRHIRNAFAHGHFEFTDASSVELWDYSPETESETFRSKYSLEELGKVYNTLEMKISASEIFTHLLIVTQVLHNIFGDEWKSTGVTRHR